MFRFDIEKIQFISFILEEIHSVSKKNVQYDIEAFLSQKKCFLKEGQLPINLKLYCSTDHLLVLSKLYVNTHLPSLIVGAVLPTSCAEIVTHTYVQKSTVSAGMVEGKARGWYDDNHIRPVDCRIETDSDGRK